MSDISVFLRSIPVTMFFAQVTTILITDIEVSCLDIRTPFQGTAFAFPAYVHRVVHSLRPFDDTAYCFFAWYEI